MQPYLFPYLGYFQLINAVDEFYFLDDVNYIKRGYSNRNYILLNGKKHRFTIPVKGASQNKKYNEIELVRGWSRDFGNLIYAAYGEVYVDGEFPNMLTYHSMLLANSIISKYSRGKYMKQTSKIDCEPATGQQRIINICKATGATRYINPIGGREIYDRDLFEKNGIELKFLKTEFKPYPQKGVKEFVPGLSILDIIFNCTPEQVKEQLNNYEIID